MNHDLYNDAESRLDTVVGSGKDYFILIKRLSHVFLKESTNQEDFATWCMSTHGFQIRSDDQGGILPGPKILDHQKYMLCLLKYGG